MRRFFAFWWLCARTAFPGNAAFANDWQWVFANPLWQSIGSAVGAAFGAVASSHWRGAPLMSPDTPIGAFLGGLFGFCTTWLMFFLVRFLNAPAVLYYDQKGRVPSGIGIAPLPHRETIQWNEMFGTTRTVDMMFALFLDGTGPNDKSIQLQDAFIESASHGNVIHMQVVGTDNPSDEPFPITDANPVPPSGFIRLIAQMNSRAPREGVPNKEFLERWRNIWFNVIYEDGEKDRISFDTSRYFPGLAGPHVTRKCDTKKE
jgi:hypothetical protein